MGTTFCVIVVLSDGWEIELNASTKWGAHNCETGEFMEKHAKTGVPKELVAKYPISWYRSESDRWKQITYAELLKKGLNSYNDFKVHVQSQKNEEVTLNKEVMLFEFVRGLADKYGSENILIIFGKEVYN